MLATQLARVLVEHGVSHVFGVVGNGNFHIADGMAAAGARYVPARHEGGAVAMADAHHRVSGQVAVCTTTYGPGFTNAATGLAEAAKHGSGVLVVCGDAPTAGRRRIDVDQPALAAALGAETVVVTDPASATTTAVAALTRARAENRPIILAVPGDLLEQPVPTPPRDVPTPSTRRTAHPPPTPGSVPAVAGEVDAVAVDAVVEVLVRAERPLLLAGLGAWRAGAGALLEKLGERVGALLATTVMADGIFAGNPWSLGICGGFSAPPAAELIAEADVVVAFGAGLGHWTLHGGAMLGAGTTLVQVDLAAPTTGRVDLAVPGDAARVAAALLAGVEARGVAPSGRRAGLAGLVARSGWRDQPYTDAGTGTRIDPRTLTLALADLLPADRTLVTDGGHFIAWPAMYWPSADPSALVFTGAAFQTIGLGFAGAVGAAVARPDRTVVAALGDGGALMGLPELETLIRTVPSALVVIYDDAAYGAEVHMYGDAGAASPTTVFTDTDFAGTARALGATAATVRTVEDLAPVRAWHADGRRGVLVLDCKVVRSVVARMLAGQGPTQTPEHTP
ncbi:thiamine pyrophosphate-binding protein [Actinomadura flavalba]|uniref:thiamine pyrophosphate-binding protein n=1 Tax=Actinomadura flavalba TaxID=1120938 RepID=UPI0003679FC1|nr:thiamine pyrophosphate-binding protein [Actinomadura flavalba]